LKSVKGQEDKSEARKSTSSSQQGIGNILAYAIIARRTNLQVAQDSDEDLSNEEEDWAEE
jgi:hypothetical protein